MDRQRPPSKKKEELTPEELWKRVSQQLSSKKQEASQRVQKRRSQRFLVVRVRNREDHCGAPFHPEQIKLLLHGDPRIRSSTCPSLKSSRRNTRSRTGRKTPSFFPKSPLYLFDNPSFYKRFDLDTLFFIFYYCKGTVQQTYAAIRLKNYAWRYHLKYKMWFQRLDEPKLITSEYEKGESIFFDYETTWNFMKKNDFVFEYFYLEQNDHY
ncbi:LOW QUALITY PROTEIN: general negative regulator of transcription subunit 3-like [Homalodisca vitripennis]|uniref:LOW QUALITY PROTEIN: general negative regulator of transcription subunit 3-like n=1 Tax=Homalodisca vitripennis TaxID=197043 RepID=UPI001EEAC7D1|nr:LOW QUALITY PROTEIN: general negative regulator of transcription subunit 3-like [Homalodisca vitripennis]